MICTRVPCKKHASVVRASVVGACVVGASVVGASVVGGSVVGALHKQVSVLEQGPVLVPTLNFTLFCSV